MVFDASAALALLLAEKGAEVAVMHLPGAVMSAINVHEVLTRLIDLGTDQPQSLEVFQTLGLTVIVHDYADAIAAAALRPITRPLGLSLGDRTCLALAQRLGQSVVTADRHWVNLPSPIPTVIMIR